jgi:hypothetical protein
MSAGERWEKFADSSLGGAATDRPRGNWARPWEDAPLPAVVTNITVPCGSLTDRTARPYGAIVGYHQPSSRTPAESYGQTPLSKYFPHPLRLPGQVRSSVYGGEPGAPPAPVLFVAHREASQRRKRHLSQHRGRLAPDAPKPNGAPWGVRPSEVRVVRRLMRAPLPRHTGAGTVPGYALPAPATSTRPQPDSLPPLASLYDPNAIKAMPSIPSARYYPPTHGHTRAPDGPRHLRKPTAPRPQACANNTHPAGTSRHDILMVGRPPSALAAQLSGLLSR